MSNDPVFRREIGNRASGQGDRQVNERRAIRPSSREAGCPDRPRSDVEGGEASARVVERVYEAMLEDTLVLAFEPIVRVSDSKQALYWACAPKLRQPNGELLSSEAWIECVVSSGFARLFDQYLVRRAYKVLKQQPSLRLGVPISEKSVVDDPAWAGLLFRLESDPDVACRLIFEIDENASLPSERARSFVNKIKRIGINVAIDNFGVEFGTHTAKEICRPDIVKIDASWIARIVRGPHDRSRLQSLIAIASDLSDHVVVKGVESESQLQVCSRISAKWVQGRYFDYRAA